MATTEPSQFLASERGEEPHASATPPTESQQGIDATAAGIPVVVHAVRHPSADRRTGDASQPLREQTHTLTVSSRGAVVLLPAALSLGDLVVLTNQTTRASALCRVVSVKAQPENQSYVELEFTQSAAGFWTHSPTAKAQPLEPTFRIPASLSATSALMAWPSVATPELQSPTSAPASSPALGLTSESLVSPSVVADSSQISNSNLPANEGSDQAASELIDNSTRPAEVGKWRGLSASRKLLWVATAILVVIDVMVVGYLLGRYSHYHYTYTVPADAVPAAQPGLLGKAQTGGPPLGPSADGARNSSAASDDVSDDESAPDGTEESPENGARAGRYTGRIARLAPSVPSQRTLYSSAPPPTLPVQSANEDEASAGSPVPQLLNENPPTPPGSQLQAPTLISSSTPVYPDLAREQSLEGVVVIDALVDATGKVAGAKVVSGPLILQQAAIDALRKFKYRPAHLNGQPIASHVNVSIRFSLQ